jgi:hypothetical protein
MFIDQPTNTTSKVFCVGDYVLFLYNKVFYKAPQSTHITSFDKLSQFTDDSSIWDVNNPYRVFGNRYLAFLSGSSAKMLNFDFASDKFSIATVNNVTNIYPLESDKAILYDGTNLMIYGANGLESTTTCPALIKGYQLSAFDGLSSVWAGNSTGICRYDISDSANPVQFGDQFGATNFSAAGCNRIFAQTSGDLFFWNEHSEGAGQLGYISTSPLALASYNRTDRFKDLTPTSLSNNGSNLSKISMPLWVVQDPKDPEVYYISTWDTGIHCIKNGKQFNQITSNNSPLTSQYLYRISYIGFDAFDNFWVAQEYPYVRDQNIHVISYSDLHKDDIQVADWKTFNGGSNIYRTSTGVTLKQSKMMAFCRGIWGQTIVFINQYNTADINDDQVIYATSYVDQDSKTLTFDHIIALTEDQKGRLWVGTNKGVFEITDPTKISSDVVTVNHLKVPRNDGTGLADYLLDALSISGIAIDNANRKWISTTTSGVYLVSEDGDEILEHYDTNNSILPSNKVTAVACDPNSSSVFFATEAGVLEYNSTASPASENLNEVYAYPNPVRPDFTGWITVTGLMDNTLVKIADSAGNVFFQGRSEGGMITWDGCNSNGDRVKTGVYYVFASHGTSSDSGSESCVTKILVIN